MELSVLTIILLLCYGLFVGFLIFKGSGKTKSINDYALGNFQFSPAFVGLSLAASTTSAATFIINPGLIGKYGISGFISYGLVLPIAAIISLIILSKKFRKFGSKVSAISLAQWIGKRYNSKGYNLFFAFLSLLLITFIVLICVGITQVLAAALNTDPVWVLLGVIIVVFSYMMIGGANAMVYTNTLQAFSMLIVAVILIGSGYEFFNDGFSGFIMRLEAINPILAKPLNPESYLFRDYFEIIFCQIIVGVAVICQPHILTKSLLLKSDKDVNKYLTAGTIVQAIFFLVIIVGLYARITFPDLEYNGEAIAPDSLVSTYVISQFPTYIVLLLIFGLISAGMSTLEGLIQALSTTITADLIGGIKTTIGNGKQFSDKQNLVINKGVIIALAIISFIFSYQQLINPNLSVAIFAQNGVYAYFSAAFVPVIFGMFLKNVPKIAPIIASVTAILVHFAIYYLELTPYMDAPVKNPAIPSAIAIVSSVITGSLFFIIYRKKTYDNRLVSKMEQISA
ncbi:sodium:solute symporter family transporter [Marinigracilibium pacificum]|uniref:Sodium:solute symporter n=1 Tax=Marinigracilibium pacificum TaxID=2729599 RepID=A0A848IZ52_9BACT|nr:sodium:solute symporter [Marinigracilibium pacificum]NMM47279.1 sodium:solute symporter [Marinigracilibium pacificum]